MVMYQLYLKLLLYINTENIQGITKVERKDGIKLSIYKYDILFT